MNKKLLFLSTMILCAYLSLCAQGVFIVEQFGNGLSNWAASKNISKLIQIEPLRSQNPSFRIGGALMQSLAAKNNRTITTTYDWDTYIACLQNEIDKGIDIKLSDIRPVPESLIEKKYPNVKYVSCNVNISGASNFSEKEVFVLKNNKIVKVEEYVEHSDPKTGRRRLHIDLSDLDLEETETIGLLYNYSKHFPGGFSVTYTHELFAIAFDMGFAGGKSDGITTKKVDFTDLMNYKMEQGAYKPKLYCTITPGVYFKYFMAGCGIGFMNLSGDLITSESNSELDTNTGQLLSSVSSVTTQSDTKFKFMIRPTIKGYIPCSEDFSIAVSLAYDLAFNYTEMNGLSFGLGFQYRFNW